jgi:hypothetical protein
MRTLLFAGLCVAGGVLANAQSTTDWPQLFGAARNATTSMAIGPNAALSIAWRKPCNLDEIVAVTMGRASGQ